MKRWTALTSLLGLLAMLFQPGATSAQEMHISNQLGDRRDTQSFDPWGEPQGRWPDLLVSEIGQEQSFYFWSREDHRSLLPEASNSRPIKIWVGGDSLAGGPAVGLRELAKQDSRWIVVEDVRKSTGVVSDWYFDWDTHLHESVADGPYEVIVLSMGGNDWQGFRRGPKEKGSVEWILEYGDRVSQMSLLLDRPGRLVIWVGIPHFRLPFMVPLPGTVNPITRQIFEQGERSDWIDAAEIVSPDGFWVKTIEDDSGNEITVRTDDGTHYQFDGARLIASAVMNAIEGRSRLGLR